MAGISTHGLSDHSCSLEGDLDKAGAVLTGTVDRLTGPSAPLRAASHGPGSPAGLPHAALAVLSALRDFEELIEGECAGPAGWRLFDPSVGAVAALRMLYPPARQLPGRGQALYRRLWAALPPETEGWEDGPYAPEVAGRILRRLDQFRAWLVRRYSLCSCESGAASAPRNREGAEGLATVQIPPDRRTRPLTLAEAGRLFGWRGGKKQLAKRMRHAIDRGKFRCETVSRQARVFDRDQFPKESWPRLTPTGPASP